MGLEGELEQEVLPGREEGVEGEGEGLLQATEVQAVGLVAMVVLTLEVLLIAMVPEEEEAQVEGLVAPGNLHLLEQYLR